MNARLSIVLMQKDEGELLGAWIDHHLEITTPGLIYIYDNGSTCHETKKILQVLRKKGVNISTKYSNPSDFERKGDIICETIQSIQLNNKSDFIIPLDCDEFLGIHSDRDGEPIFDQSSIVNHLNQLTEQEGYFKIKRHYFNHPNKPETYHVNNTPRKYFFGRSALKSLDVGYHSPKLVDQNNQGLCRDSDLIAFHYHNKAFSIRRANAINKMRNRVDSFLEHELEQYIGPGLHLLNDLRGIDTPFTPPTQYQTRSFVDHIQAKNISFPHHFYQEEEFTDPWKALRVDQDHRKELSQLRRSLKPQLDQLNDSNSPAQEPVRLQTASAEIKRRYETTFSSLKRLKQAIKSHQRARKMNISPGTIIITIRNSRSLANAYLATFIAERKQNIVFDCRNFWNNTDTQLLTLTSSAVRAYEDKVFLRHEWKCNKKTRKRLLTYFLKRALLHSGSIKKRK